MTLRFFQVWPRPRTNASCGWLKKKILWENLGTNVFTLPKTNSSHLKIGHSKRKRYSIPTIHFQGVKLVSFREGTCCKCFFPGEDFDPTFPWIHGNPENCELLILRTWQYQTVFASSVRHGWLSEPGVWNLEFLLYQRKKKNCWECISGISLEFWCKQKSHEKKLSQSSPMCFPLTKTTFTLTGHSPYCFPYCWWWSNPTFARLSIPVHPGKLTWNTIMKVWKMIFLFNWVIFRFHVNFQVCIWS